MSSISSGFSAMGVGTGGIDTASMLTQLQAAEQLRLTPYTALQTGYSSKISTWGQIGSAMTTLQATVKKLNGSAFNTLTVSTNTAFTATADASASADAHSVTVNQLATAHKLRTTAAIDDADKQLGTPAGDGATRTLTIKQGDSTVSVDLKDDQTSLHQIANAINKQDGNVNASVQRSSDGQYQLMLSSKKTGTAGEMSVSVDGDSSLAGILNTSKGGKGSDESGSDTDNMTMVTGAQDALLTVDGIDYTRSSNNISDIMAGVTLNLNAVSKDKQPEQLTLTVDTSAIKKTLQDFVSQYNALLSKTSAASKYVAADTSGLSSDDVATKSNDSGALMGDSTLRGMVGEIRSAANGWYGDSGATYGSLADLGITIDAQSGQMTLSENTLDNAIADNADELSKMFKGSGDVEGLASALGGVLTKYAGDSESKTDGIIKGATDNLNKQFTLAGTQIDKTQALIDAQVSRYKTQFQNLDSVMSKLNGMSASITSLMSSL
ncbi:flagellar hook-associated protein 2 [Enterobacter sp. BIGb0383]|uniref:flagellar filament capping protein FliD n=1 Tax=unclassified Enterobacter TaxID=2608935 RepID=UPI000F4A7A60|nr:MULTISPECIES: flagellar filament capping protein FliD [unclassified Enterobacter]ROP58317.1 flagellar hook-associated protein 2 [Enterobacter sp. BIGb0383]ROS06795.1 flagellar hook-associated protein 2 [Enterobacter sp. BIGb0359]